MVGGKRSRYRRGIALLATMLAVALMTLLVIDFTTSAALGYRSAANRGDELRAYYLAKSGVAAGLAVLEQSALADQPQPGNGTTANLRYDSLDQPWAQFYPPIAIGGGHASMYIVDEDRKINVNLLFNLRTRQVDQIGGPIIERLLANIGVSPEFLPIMVDWLDPDSIESPGGAEADYYLKLSPPYEPRNGPIPTIYDLRMLKGMDDATFIKLSRYLTAMPAIAPRVNINTAPPEVLAALSAELENNSSTVKEIIDRREAEPFKSPTEITAIPFSDQTIPRMLTTSSTYFTIIGEGDFAGARKRIYGTFRRGPTQGGGVSFTLVSWHED